MVYATCQANVLCCVCIISFSSSNTHSQLRICTPIFLKRKWALWAVKSLSQGQTATRTPVSDSGTHILSHTTHLHKIPDCSFYRHACHGLFLNHSKNGFTIFSWIVYTFLCFSLKYSVFLFPTCWVISIVMALLNASNKINLLWRPRLCHQGLGLWLTSWCQPMPSDCPREFWFLSQWKSCWREWLCIAGWVKNYFALCSLHSLPHSAYVETKDPKWKLGFFDGVAISDSTQIRCYQCSLENGKHFTVCFKHTKNSGKATAEVFACCCSPCPSPPHALLTYVERLLF